nr:hypothetical protein [Cytophagales bacterium]
MKALFFVWGFFAFSILGFKLLPKTETLALQDFESNFLLTDYPEEFLPGWSANEIRSGTSRVFRAQGKGINASTALGIQTTGAFDAQIYIKTSTIGFKSRRISFLARTERYGSGNRPVSIFYSFRLPSQEQSSESVSLSDPSSFPNTDTNYQQYELLIPEPLMEQEEIIIRLEVRYGNGSGSAARLYIDDWYFHGVDEGDEVEEPLPVAEDTPLVIRGIYQLDAHRLNVIFNQPIQQTVAGIKLSNGYGSPTSFHVNADTLTLSFEDYLYTNAYQLEIGRVQVADKEILLENATIPFEINAPTPFGAIIINEFMADPNPKGLRPVEALLPSAANDEYIELYNRMEKPIRIKEFTYNGGMLEDAVLQPRSYFILTSPAKKEIFSAFGLTASVSPFRSLPNGAGSIVLSDPFGNVIDSLSYDTSWYSEAEKNQGGWSLERINPEQVCSDSFNWGASTSTAGGTPGRENSIFSLSPDGRAFEVLGIFPEGERLRVQFSKPLSPTGPIPSDLAIDGVLAAIDSSSQNILWLRPAVSLVSGSEYNLQLGSLVDCFGQLPVSREHTFKYDIDPPGLLRVAGLSSDELRLYFDEAILPGSVGTGSTFNLSPFTGTVDVILPNRGSHVDLKVDPPLVLGDSYHIRVEGVADLLGNRLTGADMRFEWEDALDTVFFASPTSIFIRFGVAVQPDSARIVTNYVLDRNLGNPEAVLPLPDDPAAFQLIFDRQFPQNVPIAVQVENMLDREENYISTHRKTFTWDTRAIAITAIDLLDSISLRLIFNKALDEKWATIPSNFEINKGIGAPDRIFQPSPNVLLVYLRTPLEQQTTYQLSVRSLRDLFGQGSTRTINASFTYDTAPPAVDSVYLLNPFDLVLEVNKPINLPDSVRINEQWFLNPTLLDERRLLLSASIPWTWERLDVFIPSLTDKAGNTASALSLDWDISNLALSSVQILDEATLLLGFSDFLDPTNSLFVDRYLINGRVPAEVILEENGYELKLNLWEPLSLEDSLLLEVTEIRSINDRLGANLSYRTIYSDGISAIWIEQAQLIQIMQEIPLGLVNPFVGQFTWVEEDLEVQVLVDPTQRNLIQLVIDKPLPNDRYLQLRIPARIAADGTWLPGSIRTVRWDNTPPALQSVEALNPLEVILRFDELLDPILAVVPGFYQIEGMSPTEALIGDEGHEVILKFDQGLPQADSLTVIIEGLEDLTRNAIGTIRYTFAFSPPHSPSFRQLILNELMPAPRAGGLLPNVEYVELYNLSDKTFQLGGLRFGNSRNYTVLPRGTISAGEFIVLCPLNRVADFLPFGKVVGISPWPTLLNSGDELWLADQSGNPIDRISYDVGSFGSSAIAEGGYSLEVVNPTYPCVSATNIRPSIADLRGTPGSVNSVFDASPDRVAPKLVKAQVLGPEELIVTFTKPLIPENLAAYFQLSPPLELSETRLDEDNVFGIILTFTEEFQTN